MNLSLDTSFFLAVTQGELSNEEDLTEAALRLMRGESDDEFWLSILVYEELCRLRTDELEDLESIAARRMAEAALSIAALWGAARRKGKLSETVDTLIARDAWRARTMLVTCDVAQAKYARAAFGDEAVLLLQR